MPPGELPDFDPGLNHVPLQTDHLLGAVRGRLSDPMRTRQIRVKLEGRWAQYTLEQALEAAVALHQSGDREGALQLYRTVLRYAPASNQEIKALAAACYRLGNYDDALRHYQTAAAREPRNAAVRSDLGVVLSQLGRLEEAAAAFQAALALDPDNARAHSNYGDLLTDLQRYDEAEAHCRRALEIDPGFADALNNLGRVLERKGDPARAGGVFRAALAAKPGHLEASFNLGCLAHEADQPDESALYFGQAARQGADFAEAHYNHAHQLLRQGDLLRGFEEYEWRWRCKAFPSPRRDFRQPLWDGGELAGRTILLHAEQGLGDTIQFVRYAPLVAARGGRVVLEVQRGLVPLLEGMDGVAAVAAQGGPLPPFDVHCPLLSLPRVMKTTLDSVPAAVPYCFPHPDRVRLWSRLRSAGRLSVGLVWAGAPEHVNDRRRSLPLECFRALSGVPGLAWFSLQKGPAAGQLRDAPAGLAIEDLGPHLHDFADTAAVLANLDLLISADTAPAHLAGALGRPVWTLIPYTPDWRWLMDRDDSPWYPTMRLFRQFRPDDWDHVVERVRAMLAAWVNEHTQTAESARRRAVIARRETDTVRWSDPAQLEAGWDRRAAMAADLIPLGSHVLDLGCGAMGLERHLPPGCRYTPCDLVRRDERTIVCDFNQLELPPAGGATLVTLLGVLEYIYEWKEFLKRLCEYRLPVVLSYCPADLTGPMDRAAAGWVNHATREELAAAFAEAGFAVRACLPAGSAQMLYRLSPRPSLVRTCRKVLVLSHRNSGNFGDRLGFHLLNWILPPQAEATWMPVHPASLPAGDFDMAVVGIGGSIFNPILNDELFSVVDQVPVSVGIFGTQYRESIDRSRFGRLLDRLAVWLARFEEDVLLYGGGRRNVVHLGDWLVSQFPMTRWTIDGRLVVDHWVLDELPLDRTIQKIQQYREVFSERLHPLLCALTSAERVAYREQREAGAGQICSGKIRSMLMDVFGRAYPEETVFEVDRDAVAAYRARVLAVLMELPTLLSALLRLEPPAPPAAGSRP